MDTSDHTTAADAGRQVYDIDFFIPGEKKFEFDVDAATGAIIEQSVDAWEAEDDFEYAALIEKAGKAGAASVAEPAVSGELTEQMAKDIVKNGFIRLYHICCKVQTGQTARRNPRPILLNRPGAF